MFLNCAKARSGYFLQMSPSSGAYSVGALQVEMHSVGAFQVEMHSVVAFYEIVFNYLKLIYRLYDVNLY